MENEIMYLIMLNNKIFRNTQMYLDKVLKKYNLSGGTYPYLFKLEKYEGITQNKLSKEIGNDKAMSARTISKLMEQGYVYKKQDDNNCRAYNLYLTEKAKVTIPKVHEEIQNVVKLVTADFTEKEKQKTIIYLKKIFDNTMKLRNQGEN